MKQLTGWHVFAMFAFGFGTIIAVNLTLAFNAVRGFPGLEVKNSYVASQSFDKARAAQEALGWDVSAVLDGDTLRLRFIEAGLAVAPQIVSATFGRPTSVAVDQSPAFTFEGGTFSAPVMAGPGNWNLRLIALADDGTRFQQRIVVRVQQ